MKKLFLLLCLLLTASLTAQAQILRPVKWSFGAKPTGGANATLSFTANIDPNWHIYSLSVKPGGPVATSISFEKGTGYVLTGKPVEATKPHTAYEELFGMEISSFEEQATFTQAVRLTVPTTTIKGTVTYMVCDDQRCLPPEDVPFSITVTVPSSALANTPAPDPKATAKPAVPNTAVATTSAAAPTKTNPAVAATSATPTTAPTTAASAEPVAAAATTDTITVPATADAAAATASSGVAGVTVAIDAPTAAGTPSSLWAIFIAGFVGGLAALLMPCIFPLLPFTVSYFTKQDHSRRKAVGRAVIYGLSIIVIYVALGLLITVLFGADALNELATNGIFNFVFFALLLVFAASFLGAFELTLPSSWVNKADARADQGGLTGLFFMAATLALVSFSCTGPIIGTLLVQAATTGQYLGPAIGMLGFSLALALPFTLFALFPAWLKALPKSGGWLNSVKVVLGFLELALALKFLSNVDLAYHWEWFDREVFLALWIIIFGLLGFYLLDKLPLAHDGSAPAGGLSVTRLMLAIFTLSFTIYLVPGLWGAPLKAVAAFLPPQHTQDFDLYTPTLGGGPATSATPTAPRTAHKYGDLFHSPLGLDAYFDYDEARAAAQAAGKPLLIDFTGHACVNCRKMEATVWPDPRVLQRLRQDYLLVQLYVDDKTELPAAEHTTSVFSGKPIRTIANKWSDFQASRYQANSQPYYVLLDPATERVLTPPQGANYDADNFVNFLDSGLRAFGK
ncbi:disulfide bond formation protein DsbD [Hymenobacter lapidiphilus]|uniref:protein-disulfide reductase DsbD family protein n=1 Tax=Hymenobacter sp. CCM 8763 TaxID=2303334 RepID=UPI000E344760|nr:thioredoxin family protein [Hymenobacter sp. CCM 8763]RFP64659.1 disulfide bond formation protein DsbD [Hymenobacter sp. CCM 8763]